MHCILCFLIGVCWIVFGLVFVVCRVLVVVCFACRVLHVLWLLFVGRRYVRLSWRVLGSSIVVLMCFGWCLLCVALYVLFVVGGRLWFGVCCLLVVARCLLFVVGCSMSVACCLLCVAPIVCYLLVVGWCLVIVGCRGLFVVVLYGVCCSLFVVCCLLCDGCVVCCMLYD